MSEGLTEVQLKMLSGVFYIDGWHNARFLAEARDLVRRGLLIETEGGDDQYTGLRFQPVRCRADRDGECRWSDCPQLRHGEPAATGRHCPIDHYDNEE